MNLQIKCVEGQFVQPYILDLAHLRIAVFKEYPYLYQGTMEYEETYLKKFSVTKKGIAVLVFNDDHIVGASTAMPLVAESVVFQKPFLDQGISVEDVFYLGESVLLSAFRGQGVYRRFFQEREAAARQAGCRFTTFAAVQRNDDDPRKPQGYIPLDTIWQHFGYKKHPDLVTQLSWPQVDSAGETDNTMIFWLKKL